MNAQNCSTSSLAVLPVSNSPLTINLAEPKILTLEECGYALMEIPLEDLTFADFKGIFQRLKLDAERLKKQIHWQPHRYSYQVIWQNPRFEFLNCGWTPKQSSTVHDHTGAYAGIFVLEGQITSRLFEIVPDYYGQKLVETSQEELTAGMFTFVDKNEIHQLSNNSVENAITFHVYSRPLQTLNIYWPNANKSEKIAIRYHISR